MKRVMNKCLLACIFMVSVAATASDVISVKIENSSTLNVSLSKVSKGQKLYLKNYSGKILFDISLESSSTFQKYFDFNYVKNGVYFIETETEFDIKITPVLKTVHGIALIDQSEITIFKPKVNVEDTMVSVMLTRTEKAPLHVSLYDAEGIQLFKETVTEEGNQIFERTYNFSNVPSGTYFIYFTLENRKFVKEINI